VNATVGAVLPPGPVHGVPFSANEAGALLALPEVVPLKPTMNVPPLAMLLFQSALLATVTVALPAGCVNETGQPFWMRCPLGMLNTSDQPFVMVGPLLVMRSSAPKPLPPVQVGQVYATLQLADCAAAGGAAPNNNAREKTRSHGRARHGPLHWRSEDRSMIASPQTTKTNASQAMGESDEERAKTESAMRVLASNLSP
jgi:hypothetical protein